MERALPIAANFSAGILSRLRVLPETTRHGVDGALERQVGRADHISEAVVSAFASQTIELRM
jgi:hypothetical protein